jgi:glycosyltransferase involved in cell wall biosynthesis
MADLSVVLPVRNEAPNLALLLPRLHSELQKLGVRYEILILDGNSTDRSLLIARAHQAVALRQNGDGYGAALAQGFNIASGSFILTLDADLSHDPEFIERLWANRQHAEVIIASRYCPGGASYAPVFRRVLSKLLNLFFRYGLRVPVKDLSSGFRLYRASAVKNILFEGRSFEALEEIIIRAYAQGSRLLEVPFTYLPRKQGESKARVFLFGLRLLVTFFKMLHLLHKPAIGPRRRNEKELL